MIPYVQSVASQQVPPPYHFPGVTVNAFVWEAPVTSIQAYCDRYFNLGDAAERGFVYKAATAWPYAMLLVIDYPVMVCSDPRARGFLSEAYARGGYVSQQEVFVALPVVRHGTRPETVLLKSAIEWALPFIVVQNAISAVCGREMLGLEKLLADIAITPGDELHGFGAKVSLPGWASLSDTEVQRMLPFLEVSTLPAMPTYRGSPVVDTLWSLFSGPTASGAIGALSTLGNFIDTASLGLIPMAMQNVSLKQIRDAQDPGRALFQALISCRSKYSNIENFRFYNEKDVSITIHDHGSFDSMFQSILNLPENESPFKAMDQVFTRTPTAAFRFNATIDFDEMRTLHTFPVDRGPGLPPSAVSDDMLTPALRPLRGFFGPRPS